ncbi:hypothetical protein LINPERHAP2_LOCUS44523 [Linum perenne]
MMVRRRKTTVFLLQTILVSSTLKAAEGFDFYSIPNALKIHRYWPTNESPPYNPKPETGDIGWTSQKLQSYYGGMDAYGAMTSVLRLITKAAFENAHNGLRKGVRKFNSGTHLTTFSLK